MTRPDASVLNDAGIFASWRKNAAPWTGAVRGGHITTRVRLTDQAIIDAVLSHSPTSVLDIGCGEGWLARALAQRNICVTGTDVVPELIESARRAGGGEFHLVSHEQLAEGALLHPVDAVVCNFSLLGKDSVEGLFRAMPSLLNPGGVLIVQTLHPVSACAEQPYCDGWRSGSWAGFADDFSDPPPWYFRTLSSWVSLFAQAGLTLTQIHEPTLPDASGPSSVIFTGRN